MVHKDVREILKAAEQQGWRIERTKKNHYRCFPPNGMQPVTLPGTPSDHRSLQNALAQMRRAGFEWKGR